MALFLDAIVG